MPFVFQPRIAFQSQLVAGPNWVMLPSAAGVVDPLLSTGFPLTLLGVMRLAQILKRHWQKASLADALNEYARLSTFELETTARLVGALYATMRDFPAFEMLALLYFAAASFSEAARRLGKPQIASEFLLCKHPLFAPRLREACALAHGPNSPDRGVKIERIVYDAIAPFDVAGLTDATRHPWYPAVSEDLISNAPKLSASEDEIRAMLRKCGLESATAVYV
jgi:FADH2 O2-dependent halogenase